VELLRAAALVDRKRGVLAIQASGEAGLSALFESIANSDKLPTPIMSETIITMGSEGEGSLKAAISTADEKSRASFLQVASRIPGGAYMAELTTAIYTLPPDGEAYKQIRTALSPSGQAIPEAIASQRYLIDQMEFQLNKFKSLRLELTTSINSVWRWTADGKRLVTELDDSAGIQLERAYQLAILVNQLAQHTSVDSPLATAVILEHHHRLNPVVELEAADFQKAFQPKSKIDDLNYLGLVLDVAKKTELLAAQLRTVQAIGQALKSSQTDTTSTIKRLSDAVKNSAPAVRYASAVALGHRPTSEAAFEGRYALEQTKLEILSLEAKPLALVIGGSTELRDSLSQHLSLLGVRTLPARSAREAMRLIQEPQPIEYVFLADQVLEMNLSEVVQRIRSHPRTQALPLAVLTDRLGPSQRDLLANEGMTRIHYGYVTTNLDLTSTLLNEMRATSPVPKMDSLDRITLRSIFETSANN